MSEKCPQPDIRCITDLETLKVSFLWTITNFSTYTEKLGQKLESSPFNDEEDIKTKWCLSLYPNGSKDEHKEYVSLFLWLKESDGREVSANYRLAIIDDKHHIYKQLVTKYRFGPNKSGFGWNKFILKSEIKDSKNQLLSKDVLTIYCEVTYSAQRKTTRDQRIAFKRKHNTLSDDMTKLFESAIRGDINIVVKGHKFSAHKVLLMARSPVFAAMFEHSMKETEENQVIIEDIDKEVFERVMRFIYTDKVENEDIDSNKKLLSAADKYDFKSLKWICEKYIGSQLTVETVSEVLILSDTHSARELKNKAIDLIKRNANKVMTSEGWKQVMERPDLLHLF